MDPRGQQPGNLSVVRLVCRINHHLDEPDHLALEEVVGEGGKESQRCWCFGPERGF